MKTQPDEPPRRAAEIIFGHGRGSREFARARARRSP
jgi:hypothetical protein